MEFETCQCHKHTRLHTRKKHAFMHMSHWPALVDEVDSQRAQTEDEEYGYEHVVDGPDVVDLKQFTDAEEETQLQTLKNTSKYWPWDYLSDLYLYSMAHSHVYSMCTVHITLELCRFKLSVLTSFITPNIPCIHPY